MLTTETALMELEQNKSEIFKEDILNREEFVQTLLNIVINRSEAKDNITFAIDGAWGSGKTFVLSIFEEMASREQKDNETFGDRFLVLHYNCWKYDFYDEPLIALINAITDQLDEKRGDEKKRTMLKHLACHWLAGAGKLIADIIKSQTGVDTLTLASAYKNIVTETQNQLTKSHEYDNFYTLSNIFTELRTQIKSIAEDKTILFVVDELDRCTPDYAIKVLERMHHLTDDMDNTITILAYDKKKIQSFVNRVFGIDTSINYLKKFIKFELTLDIGQVQRLNDKFKDYLESFNSNKLGIKENIDEFIASLFDGIDIRRQEEILEISRLCHTMSINKKMDLIILYTELFISIAVLECGDTSLDDVNLYTPSFTDILNTNKDDIDINSETFYINQLFKMKTDSKYKVTYDEINLPSHTIYEINAFVAVGCIWHLMHHQCGYESNYRVENYDNDILWQVFNAGSAVLRQYWNVLKRIQA